MTDYTVTYEVKKEGRKYVWTRSIDKTFPGFLIGTFGAMTGKLEEKILDEAKKRKTPFKLEVIFRLPDDPR